MLLKVRAIFDYVIQYLFYATCVIITFGFLAVTFEVFMRYFFNSPSSWVFETTEYSLGAIAFLGGAYVLKNEGHVVMDTAVNLLGSRKRAAIRIFNSILGTIICLFIFWYGVQSTLSAAREGLRLMETNMKTPVAPLLVFIPIGFSLLFIQFLRRTYLYLRSWREMPQEEERKLTEEDTLF